MEKVRDTLYLFIALAGALKTSVSETLVQYATFAIAVTVNV